MCSARTEAPLSRPNSIRADASERRRGSSSSVPGERPVELDQLGVELQDVPQAREAGAGVVHGQARAERAHARDRHPEAPVVLHLCVLGHLEHHLVHLARRQQRQQLRPLRCHRRHVHSHEHARRNRVRALAGQADRRQLELGPEAHLVRLGEPDLRPAVRLAREARERLVAHDVARVERHDRLEDDVELAAVEHAPDPGALRDQRLVAAVRRVHLVHQLAEHGAVDGAVEDGVARRRGAQSRHQLLGGGVAHHEAARARSQHRNDLLVVRPTRVRQHARARRRREDRAHGVVPAAAHPRVRPAPRPDARPRRARPPARASRGHADQLESVAGTERRGRSGRRQLLIVRDQHADRHPCHGRNIPPGEARSQQGTVAAADERPILHGFLRL